MKPTYGRLVGRLYDYFFSSSYTHRRARICRSLEVFARAQGGSIVQDTYTELFPKAHFAATAYRGSVIVTPTYRGLDTFDVAAVLASTHPTMERFPFPVIQIFSRNLQERIFADRWMKPVVTGDETFDHWFVARALEPFPLNEFLGAEGKKLLFSIRYLFGKNNVYLSCQGPKVLVRKALDDNLLTEPGNLRDLWRLSRVLFRRLDRNLRVRFGRGAADWIQYVGPTDQVPVCKVCGDPIFFNRIHCSRCDTPHHLDCWEYTNGCSVYACGGKDYVFPRAAGP